MSFVDFQKETQIAQLQLGRALTETEEKQIRYNAVMREGAKIQGAHAAASQTVEGQLGALRREFNNLREDIGAKFQDDVKALIGNLRGLVGWLRENTDLLQKFGEVALWVSGALATYALADKIMALAKSIAALQLASINPYALLAVGVVGAGFAIYSQWKDTQDQLQARFDEMQRKALRDDLLSGKTSVDALHKQGMTDDQIRELVMGKQWLPGGQGFEYEGPKLTIKASQEPDLEALKRAAEIRKRQLEVERESARALEEARRRGLTGFTRDMAEVREQILKWTTFVDERGNEQRIALTRKAWENVIGELRERLANWQKEVQEANRKNLAEYLAAEEEAARRRMELDAQVFAQRLAYNEEISKRNLDHLEQVLGIEEQRAGIARDAQLRALDATNAQTLEQKLAVEQRKAAIEVEYLTRVHEIRTRLFDLETSRMVIEEEANLRRLGYRAEEIQARIAELTAQRDEIRRFQQEATDAAIQGARETAAIRQAQLIRDQNQRIFDSFKRQAEGIFDALLTKSQSIWSAIGNSLKTALLTAIKDVVTSRVAAMLMQAFTGTRVSLAGGTSSSGALGRLGGLVGVGAVPVFGQGGGPIPGGAAGGWGTPPFIPSKGGGGWASLLGGWKDFLGFGGGVQYAPGKAVTWEAATMGQKLSALGRSNAALLGGATLALMGLQRGGVSGLAMTTAGGAMIGFKYGGPLGAAIGAGIGAVAGLVRLFVKGAQEKAREKIKATYGVDIREKNILAEIVNIAKQGFGGNLDMAIRSQQVRDLLELYALSTGQGTTGLPATARPVSLLQQGGSLFQSSASGLTLDRIGSGAPSAAAATVINITVPGAKEFFEKETVRVVVENPRAVQSATMAATKQNAGRREMTGLQLSPGLIVS
jgi:gas vesicle protein